MVYGTDNELVLGANLWTNLAIERGPHFVDLASIYPLVN